MKLKKTQTEQDGAQASGSTGEAYIASRFRLDADDSSKKKQVAGVGRVSTIVALVAALAALSAIGFAAWMMFSDLSVASVS